MSLLCAALLAALPYGTAGAGEPTETLVVPGFSTVALYAPPGGPRQVVLFVSGDGGWNRGVVSMAERLRGRGALVAGIDIRSFVKTLEASTSCAYPAGPLEELSRAVQLQRRLPAYQRPVLVGYSSGATLVYAALAAAPPETFAGAISLGFCPELEIRNRPCQSRGLRATEKAKGLGYRLAPSALLARPWVVLQGELDQVCDPERTRAFVAASAGAKLYSLPGVGHGFGMPRRWEPALAEAYRQVSSAPVAVAAAPQAASPVADLGLVEVPAGRGASELFGVILSGDGGWAEIDKGLAEALAGRGIPSVGWSSLRYYWTPRTPEAAAFDLARVLEHYATAWNRPRVLLVGYSFGANVLPFLVNRLPAATQRRIAGVALLGLSGSADFEFHVSSWLGGGGNPRFETLPEVGKLPMPVTCVRGSDEADSACLGLRGNSRVVAVGRGHHFGGEYSRVVEAILGSIPER